MGLLWVEWGEGVELTAYNIACVSAFFLEKGVFEKSSCISRKNNHINST